MSRRLTAGSALGAIVPGLGLSGRGGGRGSALPALSVSSSCHRCCERDMCRVLHGAVLSGTVTTSYVWLINTCHVSRATC